MYEKTGEELKDVSEQLTRQLENNRILNHNMKQLEDDFAKQQQELLRNSEGQLAKVTKELGSA